MSITLLHAFETLRFVADSCRLAIVDIPGRAACIVEAEEGVSYFNTRSRDLPDVLMVSWLLLAHDVVQHFESARQAETEMDVVAALTSVIDAVDVMVGLVQSEMGEQAE